MPTTREQQEEVMKYTQANATGTYETFSLLYPELKVSKKLYNGILGIKATPKIKAPSEALIYKVLAIVKNSKEVSALLPGLFEKVNANKDLAFEVLKYKSGDDDVVEVRGKK